jgi:hypothetical protein
LSDELDRLLREAQADFPRPRPDLTDEVRRGLLTRSPGSRNPKRLRQTAIATLALFVASAIGFSVGRFAVPSRGEAANSISLDVKPRVANAIYQTIQAYGAVASGQSGETVVIEGFECGGYGIWTSEGKAVTGNGGTWIDKVAVGSTTRFRARWKNGTSDTVTVQARPYIEVLAKPGHVFAVGVNANDFFAGRTAVLERLIGGRWLRVRLFKLRRPAESAPFAYSYANVHAPLPRGTLVRVVLSKSQVGRCYLAGFSDPVRA